MLDGLGKLGKLLGEMQRGDTPDAAFDGFEAAVKKLVQEQGYGLLGDEPQTDEDRAHMRSLQRQALNDLLNIARNVGAGNRNFLGDPIGATVAKRAVAKAEAVGLFAEYDIEPFPSREDE